MALRRIVVGALAILLWGGSVPRARADDTREAELKHQAQMHFTRAEAADRAGDYKTALAEYREAYRIKPAAAVLYDIARDEERVDDPVAAAADYQRYIDESDELEDAEVVRKKISALRGAAGTRLVNAAIAAKGGAAKLKAVKAFVARGTTTITTAGQKKQARFTRWVQGTDRSRIELDYGNGASEAQVVTPEAAWVERNGVALTPSKQEETDARAAFWRDKDLILLRPRDEGAPALAMGAEIADGRRYDVVVIERADGANRTRVLIDPGTHLPAILEAETSAGRVRAQISAYRAIDGVQFVVDHTSVNGPTQLEVHVDDLQINPDLPARLFDRTH